MWIIKNRMTNEYDTKGLSQRFCPAERAAWTKLGSAKNHVINKVGNNYPHHDILNWYCNADFINIGKDDSEYVEAFPVIEYLRKYYECRADHLSGENQELLGFR